MTLLAAHAVLNTRMPWDRRLRRALSRNGFVDPEGKTRDLIRSFAVVVHRSNLSLSCFQYPRVSKKMKHPYFVVSRYLQSCSPFSTNAKIRSPLKFSLLLLSLPSMTLVKEFLVSKANLSAKSISSCSENPSL